MINVIGELLHIMDSIILNTNEYSNLCFFQVYYRISRSLRDLEVYLNRYPDTPNRVPLGLRLHSFREDLSTCRKFRWPSIRLYNIKNLEKQFKKIVYRFGYPSLSRALMWGWLKIKGCSKEELKQALNPFMDIIETPIGFNKSSHKTQEGVRAVLNPLAPALSTFYGQLYGCSLLISTPEESRQVIVHVNPDIHQNQRKFWLQTRREDLLSKLNAKKDDVKWDDYLMTLSWCQYLTLTRDQQVTQIYRNWEEAQRYQKAGIKQIFTDYQFCKKVIQKYQLLVRLLNSNMVSIAVKLLNNTHPKHVQELMPHIDWIFRDSLLNTGFIMNSQIDPTKSVQASNSNSLIGEDLSYEARIQNSKWDEKTKKRALQMAKRASSEKSSGSSKAETWVSKFLNIPLESRKEKILENRIEEYKEEFIKNNPQIDPNLDREDPNVQELVKKINKELVKFSEALEKARNFLDTAFHGHKELKIHLIRFIAQLMTGGGENGLVIAIYGPPGNGKTTAILSGLAYLLIDENNKPRPSAFISLSGETHASKLQGHNYTWHGSNPGAIVDQMMYAGCDNMILLFDEVDKCHKDVQNVLIKLTDPKQSHHFNDNYFDGIPINTRRMIKVFTFNDPSLIDPVLMNRMKPLIKTNALTTQDKIVISRKHIIPEISKFVKMDPNKIKITDQQLEYIIHNWTREAGARDIRQHLIDLVRTLNVRRITDSAETNKFTYDDDFVVTDDLIKDVFKDKRKIQITKIPKTPLVGQINGMWTNAAGLGGISYIQVKRRYCDKTRLKLTGSLAEVTQESIECALAHAIELFIELETLNGNEPDLKTVWTQGFHIHMPSGATKKDGPSAGGAICMAILSLLTNRPIKNDVSMTGEIDLMGNITRIGLGQKLKSYYAGVRTVIIPLENLEDLELLRRNGLTYEDRGLSIHTVSEAREAIPYVFGNDPYFSKLFK